MIKWISFQSLAGGMMIGAEQAFGSSPLFTIDYDGIDKANSSAYVNYMNNIRNTPLRQLVLDGNLLSRTQTFKNTDDELYFNEVCHDIDVVCSVPICSGLSQANTCNDKTHDGARGSDAKQNNNMLGIAEFVFNRIKPKVYIFENAPNLFSTTGKGIRDRLKDLGNDFGYSVTWVKTDSHLHENVQWRNRTFGIFWKDSKCPEMTVVNNPAGTIVDYLNTISETAKYNTDEYNLFTDYKDNGFIKYMKVKYGDNYQKFWPLDKARMASGVIEKNGDFELAKSVMNEKECKFIDHIIEKRAQGKNYFDNSPLYIGDSRVPTVFGRTLDRLCHPTEDRGYTVREALKFMGMPDDYEIEDIMNHLAYIGQNVPVITARDWCLQIRNFIEGNSKISTKSEDYFDNVKLSEVKEEPAKFVFGRIKKTLN